MSNVTMSLKEYNEMVEQFNLYKEIVEAVATPLYSKWDIDWYMSNPGSSLSLRSVLDEGISRKASEFIKKLVAENINKFMEEYDIQEGTPEVSDILHMNIGQIVRKQEEEE